MRRGQRIWWKGILACCLVFVLASSRVAAVNIPQDTIQRITMIFEVHHGENNIFNLSNHPSFQQSAEKFTFNTPDILPKGMTLSTDGLISWSPSAAQFEQIKQLALIVHFSAHSEMGDVISGQLRVLGVGEVVQATDTIQSIVVATQDTAHLELVIIMPESDTWKTAKENEEVAFQLAAEGGKGGYKFELLEPEYLRDHFGRYGEFAWTPDYDFVTANERVKTISLQFKLSDAGGNEALASAAISIQHVNRPPVVNELPTFYIQFNSPNSYQLKKDGLVFDPDGDSIIFIPILKDMLQGMAMDADGVISWKPSKRQFNQLSAGAHKVNFHVEDYPAGEEASGTIRLEVSQADLPPEITMIPNQRQFDIKEDEELHLTFFITDPNGEDDLLSFGFVSGNGDINEDALVEKEPRQYEFSWTPGYDFINEPNGKHNFEINFFAIDKESNRTERKIDVTVTDTENLLEKDRILYDQYRTVLARAFDLITQLNEKESEMEKKYNEAKKGKKKRAIITAALGAITGLSPILFLDNPNGQKITAGIGGTATATLGTLEASNVIGESPSDIMRDLNYVSQKRNDLLVYGNVFASKYALPLSKRDNSFQSDLRSLSIHLSLKDVANLELDAAWENDKPASAKNIKKIFKDFNPDARFEEAYKE